MKKDQPIVQKIVNLNPENIDNHMIIIFMENGEVVSMHLVKLPKWFCFYDSDYRYYPQCLN